MHAQPKWRTSTHVAREVVAGALAVELAEAVADVAAGLVVRDELLGLEARGAGVAHVDTGHDAGGSSKDLRTITSQMGVGDYPARLHAQRSDPISLSPVPPGALPCSGRVPQAGKLFPEISGFAAVWPGDALGNYARS